MAKMSYTLKNLFKSPEQKELEARMEFMKNKRAFTKYSTELEASIKNFSKMARDAELSGNHQNAVSCASFVIKLQNTQTKVQSLLGRFEMMYSMQRLSGVMSNFMKAATDMGYNMDANINLKDMWKNTAEMEKALNKLDAMSDQMDMVFDAIDSGMNLGQSEYMTDDEKEADASKMLDQIMGRYNTVTEPESAGGQKAGNDEAEINERLQKMMQELKD